MYIVKRKDGTFKTANLLKEIEDCEFSESEVYACIRVHKKDFEADIRDAISIALKGNNETKDELIEHVQMFLDIPKYKILKVITKMMKEGTLFYVEGCLSYDGHKLIGIMEE